MGKFGEKKEKTNSKESMYNKRISKRIIYTYDRDDIGIPFS